MRLTAFVWHSGRPDRSCRTCPTRQSTAKTTGAFPFHPDRELAKCHATSRDGVTQVPLGSPDRSIPGRFSAVVPW